ncbi:glutathione hydrolase 7-like [Melanotaenia boesemani]|uniref:glutathione hydrolase 7-like n=1 Tax=Melanotaenia boesemani TaxID=1250792 RepID=UPI001C04D321|nr:glutathione hydrolase 7-like [Melanotaenia boesemani]
MDASPETQLNKQSTCSYKSFGSSELADGSSTNDLKKHDPIQMEEISCGSPNLFDQSLSKLKEKNEDCCNQGLPVQAYAVLIIFAVGVTIALFLQINLDASLVGIKAVQSDHELCTALAQRVLLDGGSSVDAAVAGALCLGVVHPHVSGVGGGGVMLIHDIQRNETKVINFQGSAPRKIQEEMLQNASEVKAGLLVGVPGMLMGLHHAHSLYGSLSWADVVSRAADVARRGFNMSQSLADAVSKVEDEQLLGRFRDLFNLGGRDLSPGSYVRMPELAQVLEAGLLNFYHGTLSQEMEDEVRANGGILSREDISNYSVEVQKPLEGHYNEVIIQVPPPPSAGAALIAALNLLESFFLRKKSVTENQTSSWIDEALTAALAMTSGLGDPKYSSIVTEFLSVMLRKNQTEVLHQRMNSSETSSSGYNSTIHSLPTELLTGQVVVMGPDNLMVSVASSLSRPFGSRIITKSGIVLNSLILDFIWPNKTKGQPQTHQTNGVEPGKRPLTFLMPSVMLPAWSKCGTYMALSSSGGQIHLHPITQMLVRVLFLHKEKNESLSLGGLHPKLGPNSLDDSEFPVESVEV